MKKKILICLLIIVLIVVAIKIREVMILNKVYLSREKFKEENNRYFQMNIILNNKNVKKEMFKKDDIEILIIDTENIGNYCERKDNASNSVVAYNSDSKIKYENNLNLGEFLLNTPNVIQELYPEGKISISELLKIHYILPITYNGKACYKISTSSEVVIIDKDTYLPVYSSVKTENSNAGSIDIEYTYIFEVGTVTDEDVKLPDFSEYTIK